MPRRHWTLLVVPDDHTTPRQLRVSEETVRYAAGGAVVLLLVLLSLAIGFFVKQSHHMRADRLAQENELLVAEVEQIRGQLASFQGTMNELAERDRKYRLIAGLDPIHEEVQQAGIGGPGMATLDSNELWQRNPELGEATFSTAYDLNALSRRAQLLASSWAQAVDTLEAKQDRHTRTPSIMPTTGYISSAFNHSRWHPILGEPRPHEGIDVSAPEGTPILAVAAGRVTYSGRRGQYGYMVEIDHGDGIRTRYAHAREQPPVRVGQFVERWDKIAEVGQTGLADGPHVHYEVIVDDRPVNPRSFILNTEAIPD